MHTIRLSTATGGAVRQNVNCPILSRHTYLPRERGAIGTPDHLPIKLRQYHTDAPISSTRCTQIVAALFLGILGHIALLFNKDEGSTYHSLRFICDMCLCHHATLACNPGARTPALFGSGRVTDKAGAALSVDNSIPFWWHNQAKGAIARSYNTPKICMWRSPFAATSGTISSEVR